MMKSILKTFCFMLFRNAIMWALMFAWLIKGVAGAGHVLSAYVVITALLVIAFVCVPAKPEEALKTKLAGKFWRGAEVVSQCFILIGLIWFGHFVIAVFWAVACLGLSIIRIRILEAKKKAQKDWMERDAAEIMSAFGGMNQQSPPAQPA